MNWIDRIFSKQTSSSGKKANIPEGIWTKCTGCDQVLYRDELTRHLEVCPKCGHHMAIDARSRLLALLDKENTQEIASELEPKDILKFKDLKRYKERLIQAQKNTGEKDALIAMKGTLFNMPVVVCAANFDFMGGSMGAVVGAKFVLAVEEAMMLGCPLISFSASGGARMQEALISLMQMAKTSAALAKLKEASLPFVSVLTNPTFGGVSASYAMLGDIIIAEPRALIGFAGARVIEQTVRETLPEGFQRAEFLLEKGAIDMIVKRSDMRNSIADIVAKLMHKPNPFNE